jgi:energy-coupling factor transport system substrate-specific component
MAQGFRWRTVDIVVGSIIGVAFGVVFWGAGWLWNGPAEAVPVLAKAPMYGVWLIPAVLGGLVIRKPGAAFYCETVAALVSVALGTAWGWTLVLQGPLEAAAGELAFALFAYRLYTLGVAMLAGALSGLGASLYDLFVWYPGTAWGSFRLPYVAITVVSCVLVAGIGSWALTRALAQAGVLDRFAAGRERAAV